MKILVLIISDESSQVYIKHKEIWLKYMNINPQFDCFFIEYHPEKNYIIEENTIYIKGTESYHPGIREKTIETFKYFLNCDKKYDYIIRTNLSSHWNFKALLTYLKTLPKEDVYYGGIGECLVKFASSNLGECSVKFASGSGFIMTPDVMNKIVENRNLCNEINFIDDVDIGYLLKKIGIFPSSTSRTDITNDYKVANFQYNSDIYHYRIKLENRDNEFLAASKILNMILSDS
jgi:hypothetical protein